MSKLEKRFVKEAFWCMKNKDMLIKGKLQRVWYLLLKITDVAYYYRTRIGKLKRQVQQLNKENKLLREQYNILFNDGKKIYQELKEIKNGNETN